MELRSLEAAARQREGTVLKGKYRLDQLLGIGGMAAVYAATHTNGKRFAVKIQHPHLSADVEQTRRFMREGYAANKVEHPGAVEVFDDDIDDAYVFLVMELLEGEPLFVEIERAGGTLGVDRVVALTLELLDVVAAAHDKGIVHRDIKPENLFVTRDGRLRLLDFGTARIRDSASRTHHTEPFAFMGTIAYMAPEQARGRQDLIDARTDLWSMGATMFLLLSGQHVHEATTTNERLGLTMTVPARSLAEVAPNLPAELIEVVDRALAFEQEDRWPDARSMQNALQVALDGSLANSTLPSNATPALIAPREDSKDPSQKRRSMGWPVALGAVALLGVGHFSWRALSSADAMQETRASEAPSPRTPASLPAPTSDARAAAERESAQGEPPDAAPLTDDLQPPEPKAWPQLAPSASMKPLPTAKPAPVQRPPTPMRRAASSGAGARALDQQTAPKAVSGQPEDPLDRRR